MTPIQHAFSLVITKWDSNMCSSVWLHQGQSHLKSVEFTPLQKYCNGISAKCLWGLRLPSTPIINNRHYQRSAPICTSTRQILALSQKGIGSCLLSPYRHLPRSFGSTKSTAQNLLLAHGSHWLQLKSSVQHDGKIGPLIPLMKCISHPVKRQRGNKHKSCMLKHTHHLHGETFFFCRWHI